MHFLVPVLLTVFGTLADFGSFQCYGTLTNYGSLARLGTLSGVGSLIAAGTLFWTVRFGTFGTLLSDGSLSL